MAICRIISKILITTTIDIRLALAMLPSKKERLFKEKQPTNISELNNSSVEKFSTTNNLFWQESVLRQIDKKGPVIAKTLSEYLTPVIEKSAEKIAVHFNHLSELKALQKAYENQWILDTYQVSKLLHVEPQTILKFEQFEQHGFIFCRSERMLSKVGWKVKKSVYEI